MQVCAKLLPQTLHTASAHPGSAITGKDDVPEDQPLSSLFIYPFDASVVCR